MATVGTKKHTTSSPGSGTKLAWPHPWTHESRREAVKRTLYGLGSPKGSARKKARNRRSNRRTSPCWCRYNTGYEASSLHYIQVGYAESLQVSPQSGKSFAPQESRNLFVLVTLLEALLLITIATGNIQPRDPPPSPSARKGSLARPREIPGSKARRGNHSRTQRSLQLFWSRPQATQIPPHSSLSTRNSELSPGGQDTRHLHTVVRSPRNLSTPADSTKECVRPARPF